MGRTRFFLTLTFHMKKKKKKKNAPALAWGKSPQLPYAIEAKF